MDRGRGVSHQLAVVVFIRMVSMVLVPWGVAVILGNRYEVQGQSSVVLFQGSEATAGFLYRNWIMKDIMF